MGASSLIGTRITPALNGVVEVCTTESSDTYLAKIRSLYPYLNQGDLIVYAGVNIDELKWKRIPLGEAKYGTFTTTLTSKSNGNAHISLDGLMSAEDKKLLGQLDGTLLSDSNLNLLNYTAIKIINNAVGRQNIKDPSGTEKNLAILSINKGNNTNSST
jgi:hypothetical protein